MAKIQHVQASSESHANVIVCDIALRSGAVTTVEGDGCVVVASGFEVRGDNILAVITWD
jgi:hypothetical protein